MSEKIAHSKISSSPSSSRHNSNDVKENELDGEGEGEDGDGTQGEEGEEMNTEEEEEEEEEVDLPYFPPPPNFIYILRRDASQTPVNMNCRKAIFLDYIRKILVAEKDCVLDFCDLDGALTDVKSLNKNDYVLGQFEPKKTYVTCRIAMDESGLMTDIRPLLEDWQVLYPQMEDSIKEKLQDEADIAEKMKAEMKKKAARIIARQATPDKAKTEEAGSKKKRKKIIHLSGFRSV